MRYMLLVIALVIAFSAPAFAGQGPPEDFDKLNANAEKRFIVEESGAGVLNIGRGRTKPYPGKPKEAAENFLREYHRMFNLSGDLNEIRFDREGGIRGKINQFDYQQYYKGVPVSFSEIKVRLDMQNRVIRAIGSIKIIGNLSVEPVIQPEELADVLALNAPEYGPILTNLGLFVEFYHGRPILVYQLSTTAGENYDKKPAMLSINANTGVVLKCINVLRD